jgi:heme exporter protein D
MGGYAAFVWPSYGLALVVLIANVLLPRRRHQRILNELRRAGYEAGDVSQPTVRHVP